MIEGILVEGLVYSLMVLGVFITFRILNFPDLTVDGSFPLGAAIMAVMITQGAGLWLGLAVSFAGGLLAGMVTALIHNKLKVPNLLAGILTMTMLWSINIRVLGNRANLPLLRQTTVLTHVRAMATGVMSNALALLIFFLAVTLIAKFLVDVFFRTDLGLTMGAMGNNEQMVIATGANPETLKLIGVGLSNALVALSGAFVAQYQGFADVNLGQGIIIAGLASVMIGEFLVRSNRIWILTSRAVLGSILYRGIMYLGRYYGYYVNLTPNDLKLITGLLIICSLVVTQMKTGKPKALVALPGTADGGPQPLGAGEDVSSVPSAAPAADKTGGGSAV